MVDHIAPQPPSARRYTLSRRSLLTGVAAGLAGAAIGAPAVLRAQPSTMTVPNSGGALEEAYKPAYFDTFKAKTGIQILGAPYMDAARVKAMVENNAVDVDVLNIDATEAAALARLGLLEPIDYGVIDKSVLLPQAAREHYLLADVAAYVMAWNTRSFDAQSRPKDWAEFFDAKAKPGQRSLWKLAPQTLEVAAMGLGQARDKLYPIDLDRAFKGLDTIKPDLTWWTSGAQGAQLLIAGEVDVGTTWNGRLFKAKKDGAPVDYTFDNALYVCDAMVIPKGARNKKLAMEFLANMMDAQNQATFSKSIPYGPVNTKAFELLDPAERALLPNSPENGKTAVFQDFDYWAESGPKVFDRFNAWLLG
ncbi:ABC transporter substrate-binding protein [Labrys wisconsinensis]|uniref:Spermidine/putrescine transport system substrate-binding protein n=1 Tax=Labrys wisconsinensis TaxID=425677 RepID=A0ABU0J281_9HYPH|nr:ABC transporter substrate-binding protein [Labrys wisconsinensis]MDQ0468368.1 putative spermidine/putrescine transport system substrate-binding protein [Labrys wisconsinensis]